MLEICKRASGKNYHSYSDSTLHVRKKMESVSSSYSMKLLPETIIQKTIIINKVTTIDRQYC